MHLVSVQSVQFTAQTQATEQRSQLEGQGKNMNNAIVRESLDTPHKESTVSRSAQLDMAGHPFLPETDSV